MYYIPLSQIDPNPWQPRQAMDPDKIKELAESIKSYAETRSQTKGLLQLPAGRVILPEDPHLHLIYAGDITFALSKGCRVQLAFGHRRKAAFELLGYPDLPVELADYTDEEMATMAWTENNDRDDLTAIDRAKFVQRLMADFQLTQEKAAQKLNMSRPAVSNLLRLLDLPADQQALVQEGKISPRAADALLQLQALPQALQEQAEKHSWNEVKPSSIIAAAGNGASSDVLRERIGALIGQHTIELNPETFSPSVDIAGEGVLSPKCDDCDQRIAMKNKPSRCPSRECNGIKRQLWEKMRLQAASQATGIPVFPDGEESWRAEAFYGDEQEAPQILARRCENLRLTYHGNTSTNYQYRTLASEGYPDISFVCNRKGDGCACLKALEAGQDPDQFDPGAAAQAAAEEEKQRKANEKAVKALEKQAAGIFAQGLAEGHIGAWRKLLASVAYSSADKSKDWDLDRIRLEIAMRQAPSADYTNQANPDAARQNINKALAKLGLPEIGENGHQPDAVDGLVRRWERIAHWLVHSLVEATPEAIRGNLDNLGGLTLDLNKLIQSGQAKSDDPRLQEMMGDHGLVAWIDRLAAMTTSEEAAQ